MMDVMVFITVYRKRVTDILDAITSINSVTEAGTLTGKYDLYARIEVQDSKELLEVVQEGIRSIDGILSTETSVITKQYFRDAP